jgi:hypothetical protein
MAIVIFRVLASRDCLLLEVWDLVPTPPTMRQADLCDESGRGLSLVDTLAHRWHWKAVPDCRACASGRRSQAKRTTPRSIAVLPPVNVGQNLCMSTLLSFHLGSSLRDWLMLRMSTNPFSATGGPLPQITIPLEVRLAEQGIDIEILRFTFDLKLGNTLVGQGEIGPITRLSTRDRYFTATATCPRDALPYLFNPSPPEGRLTLGLELGGLVRYRHTYSQGDGQGDGLGDPDDWHVEAIGEQSAHRLEVQIARSDWYEHVVTPLGIGSYLVTPLYLPFGVASWQTSLKHLDEAGRALTAGDPPAVFGYCRAALDALPGAKTKIFDAMPEGKKRDAINELTKQIGIYIHSGRHVEPNGGSEQTGDFPVDQRDAVFVYNMTKLLLSQIYSVLTSI